ncbi:MAG: hypothetical protein WC139_09120 [Candidatus Kapaibacterium sp.]
MKSHSFYRFASILTVIALFVVMSGCGKEEKTKQTTEKAPAKTETKTETKTTNSGNTTSGSNDGTLAYDVINNTGVTLIDVFVTPAETDNWGNDILPNDVFENGSTIKVTIPPDYGETCMFDMKITDAAGGHITFTNIDICKLIKLKINADATFDYVETK